MVHIVIKVKNTNSKLDKQSRVISGGNSISKPGWPNAHIMNKKEVTTTKKKLGGKEFFSILIKI